MYLKIKNILKVLILLNIMMYPIINAEARNAYIEALREVGKIAPSAEEEVLKTMKKTLSLMLSST